MIRLGGLIFMALIVGIWAVFALIDHTENSVIGQKPTRRIATAVLKLPDAREALSSEDPIQREGAALSYADALIREGKLEEAASYDPLIQLLLADPKPAVRATAATALGSLKSPHGLRPLLSALDDPAKIVRSRAALAIGRTTGIYPNLRRINDTTEDRREVIENITPMIESHLRQAGLVDAEPAASDRAAGEPKPVQ
ncbi:MAG: HEAT repeat domain-containing protein [Phycisphaeraceae bacterium]|nr:HEAT repeat domain-containing protein [Phycisphaeraceae bacterium]